MMVLSKSAVQSCTLQFSGYFEKDNFSICYIKSLQLIVTFCDLATVVLETKNVTKSRVHCNVIGSSSILVMLNFE